MTRPDVASATLRQLLGIALPLLCTACIGAFDMFAPTKRIVGPYELFRRETGRFDIGGPGKPAGDAGGYVDGIVDSLGWTPDRILVRRAAPLYGGDPVGWLVVDVHSGTVTGPVSAAERAADPTLAHIVVRSAEDVWKK